METHPGAGHLLEDAQVLLAATAHVAEGKVMVAQKRLATCLEKGRDAWEIIQQRTVAGVRATNQTIREHPCHSVGATVNKKS